MIGTGSVFLLALECILFAISTDYMCICNTICLPRPMYLSSTPYWPDVLLISEPRIQFPLTSCENHGGKSGNRAGVSRSAVVNCCDWSDVSLFQIRFVHVT
jgi:hypothetical protein